MNTFSTHSTVNRQEAEALKEMIFNRVRARAEAMSQEIQTTYTDNFQTEIMELAKASVSGAKNPFSSNTPQDTVETVVTKEPEEITLEKPKTKNYNDLGFDPTQTSYLSAQIRLNTTTKNEEITKNAISSTMDDAHKSLENKSTFMGALNFLNSQASIAIVTKTGKRFEANA